MEWKCGVSTWKCKIGGCFDVEEQRASTGGDDMDGDASALYQKLCFPF